jgi:hypothetical protein
LLRGQTNGQHNTFQILHHLIIGKPKHPVSARCKPFVASLIMPKPRFEIVTFAIDFYDKLAGMRDEIGDIISHWGLSAKPWRHKPMRLQMTP